MHLSLLMVVDTRVPVHGLSKDPSCVRFDAGTDILFDGGTASYLGGCDVCALPGA